MSTASNIAVLDEFLDMVKEAMPSKDKDQLKSTQRKEIDLWHNWNTNGRKSMDLKPLYESYKPVLQRRANDFRGLEMPTSTIHAELRKHFVNAVKTYDPKKGTQLNTWVNSHLRKVSRFVKMYQNFGKIPEENISNIREFKKAKEDLVNKFGYEPDTHTLADHLKWPHKRVIQIETELSRKDKPASGYVHDPAEILAPKELEAVHLLQYDTRLSGQERSVYEYTFGVNGKPALAPGAIAKKVGLHPSKISRIRGKIKNYLNEAREAL